MSATLDRLRALEGAGLRTFASPEPLVWARTAGSSVWGEDGRAYTDLHAAMAVATVGHCHPRVTEAIVRQAGTMTHAPSSAPTALRADLYERLIALAPAGIDRALVMLTGSQANETAIQLARAATGRHGVISFSGTYLGRSLGTARYAGKRAYRERLGLTTDGQFLPYPDPYRSPWAAGRDPSTAVLALLEEQLSDPASGVDAPACIIVEPVQGNAGVVIPPDGFLAGLRRIADRAGALLVFDEIQCGLGRSGRDWACGHEGVVPDLMTVGKGIGGGMPVAAVLGRAEVLASFAPDTVTSTFLANALSCAAAVAALDIYRDEQLAQRSAALGAEALARLAAGLADAPAVGDVRGRGLFIGVELVAGDGAPDARAASTAAERLRRAHGVLVGVGGRYGNVIKVAPPLVIGEQELESALAAVMEVLA